MNVGVARDRIIPGILNNKGRICHHNSVGWQDNIVVVVVSRTSIVLGTPCFIYF